MRILVAPQEYKGTLSAQQAAAIIASAVAAVRPEIEVDLAPMADGGMGTVDAFLSALPNGIERWATVRDPLGRPAEARWAWFAADGLAILEMAAASGLHLVAPHERRILDAHTFGTGELLRTAVESGARRVLLGAGGSATQDGGAGAAQALGVRFFDAANRELPLGARHLLRLSRIDATGALARLRDIPFEVLTDVETRLLGQEGSAALFASQKGADDDAIELLEAGLERLVQVARAQGFTTAEHRSGSGAAGGLPWALATFFGAQLKRGFDAVSDVLGLSARVAAVDVVITGEGRVDHLSTLHKGPYALGRVGKMQGKRVACFAGFVHGPTAALNAAFDDLVSLGDGPTDSSSEAERRLDAAVRQWAAQLPSPR